MIDLLLAALSLIGEHRVLSRCVRTELRLANSLHAGPTPCPGNHVPAAAPSPRPDVILPTSSCRNAIENTATLSGRGGSRIARK